METKSAEAVQALTPEQERIARAKARWREKVAEAFGKRPAWKQDFTTVSGAETSPLATPDDLPGFDYERDLGWPGEFPYTRGVQPTMYRGRPWTIRQFAGFGTAEQTNHRFKVLLSHGQTGLSTAFHLPTLYGYDSDHPMSAGEVGKCGVAIDTLRDFEALFDGIDLGVVTTSMTINSTAPIALAMYLAVAEKQGTPWTKVGGTLQNDILKEYIAQKEFIFPPRPSMRLVTDQFAFCARHVPRRNTVSISGYHIREAGSTALQELAFTPRDGMEYVKYGVEAGLPVDEFAPRLSFFFNAHNDFFEEIAKYRAARRIWAKVMRDRYGARSPESWKLRFHTQTAGCSLTAQQPFNNVARVAVQALAAVLGGAQSLHTNSMDEALALPSEEAVTVALRTQQILAHESGVTNTVDPVGGSWFVESLTTEMEAQALQMFARIAEYGGVLPALEEGYFQREITESALRYQREIESKRRVIVGVNEFATEKPQPVSLLRMDVEGYARQKSRLDEVRRTRDNRAVQQRLGDLARASRREGENLMEPILGAVREYATLQEMMDVLRESWGIYEEPAIL